jgi:hypothetical protein
VKAARECPVSVKVAGSQLMCRYLGQVSVFVAGNMARLHDQRLAVVLLRTFNGTAVAAGEDGGDLPAGGIEVNAAGVCQPLEGCAAQQREYGCCHCGNVGAGADGPVSGAAGEQVGDAAAQAVVELADRGLELGQFADRRRCKYQDSEVAAGVAGGSTGTAPRADSTSGRRSSRLLPLPCVTGG